MAYYAVVDGYNIVTEVFTGKDEGDTIIDWERYYSDFLNKRVLRTSYNTFGGKHLYGKEPFRKNYAGVGYTYDPHRDAFIPPKPYESWILNEETCLWESPIPYPEDGNYYIWDEENLSWEGGSIDG